MERFSEDKDFIIDASGSEVYIKVEPGCEDNQNELESDFTIDPSGSEVCIKVEAEDSDYQHELDSDFTVDPSGSEVLIKLLQLNSDDNDTRATKKNKDTQPSLHRARFTGNKTKPRRNRANEIPSTKGNGYELDPREDVFYTVVRLMDAARIGDLSKMKDCIDRGVDVNAEGSGGKTALHYAAMNNRLECAEYLLTKKAKVNTRDARGRTPMHCAASKAHIKIVKALISGGADVDPPDASGMTPLQYAASRGFNAVVHALLLQGGNPEHRNDDGHNAVQIAAIANRVTTIDFLSSYNARHTK